MIDASQHLGLGSGLVVGVPIPAEAAAEGEVVERAIARALDEAASKGVQGNEVSGQAARPPLDHLSIFYT